MATWVDGVGVGNQLFSFKRVLPVALLILIAICASVPTLYAQSQSERGFVSLDCGSAQASYNDSYGLEWVADDAYMTLGSSHQQNYAGTDKPALKSFRDFPGDRSKYCYEIQTLQYTYLIRVSFYMDHSEVMKREPFQFKVCVDGTDWFTVTSGDSTTQSPLLVVQEGIFYPPNLVTYLCLQSGSGKPFISSVEVRWLDGGTTYLSNYIYGSSQYLALGVRYNAGAQNVSDVRYPADVYDRIWTTPDPSVYENFTAAISNTWHPTVPGSQYNVVPVEVMQDALLFPAIDGPDYLSFQVFSDGPHVYATPSVFALSIVYFANLNGSAPGPFAMIVRINNIQIFTNFSSGPGFAEAEFCTLSENNINIFVGLESAAPGASINALEVFNQINFNASITVPDDAYVIALLKVLFSLSDWQGDPCVPVPFNWLSCDVYRNSFRPGQQQCSGSGSCQPGPPNSVFATLFNVTTLNISNVANINLSILANPSALPQGRLRGLTAMSITSSGVDYSTFLLLLNYTYGGLTTLNMSYNAIRDLPAATNWAGTDDANLGNLITLDLSHNNITGVLSSFNDVPFSTTLQNLNLSYNNLTSFPGSWKNTTIKSLVTLNLSHNQFSGDISSLDQWIQINSESLQELDISYNRLTGGFSSDLYFSLPTLIYANFDNNSIQGTLNLTRWYARLQNGGLQKSVVTSNNTNPTSATQLVLSFKNNQISSIVPDAKDFADVALRSLLEPNPSFGMLLHGNPYCNDVKSDVQEYLCSPASIKGTYQDGKKISTKEILIISIVGGVVALLFFSITSATLWKLWRQLFTLRGIQQALAERKVQPPFYQYTELKAATKQFHESNKLGQGGFGVVYKGFLKEETLAVKKLFNSQKLQVLDEFLNEVMLISGIKHRNLIQLKGCCIKDKQRILVYEHAERGNLAEALWGSNANWKLSWKHRLNICVGVARGLSYLHEELQPYIIHRDIKPENILLDRNFNPKIADFGLARHISDETSKAHYTQIAGTLGYFAPEYAMQGQVSDKTDVYSYGILILEVVSGRKCIDSTLPIEERFLKDWVFNLGQKSSLLDILQPELTENCDVAEVIRAINIALLCVQHHPEKRPTMSQVVTMFLGNMDVEISLNEFDNIHSNFKDLMATMTQAGAQDVEHPALHIIEGESPVSCFVDKLDSHSSFEVNSSNSNSRHGLELGAAYGR